MKKYSVFVSRIIPDAGIKLLKKKGFDVEVYPHDTLIKKEILLKKIRGKDALISILTDPIDAQVMQAGLPTLKVISNYAVGVDNVDLAAARARKIMVTNTAVAEVSESVAEHVMAMMFALAHRIVETDRFTRFGKYHGWGPNMLLGTDIMGKTVGIIGLGRIGRALARRLFGGFGVHILYADPKQDTEFELAFQATYVSQTELLKKSDFISLHVPLLPSTRHLISTKELKMMKKTAFLINTSRGPVVDELALVKALKNKKIGGAGLDVYECEPLIDCNPKDMYQLRTLDNVVLTPHTASATLETRQAMSLAAAQNVIDALSGKRPENLVM